MITVKTETKRIDWLDISKCIAIILMVWCHAGIPDFADKIIHVFHMPIFFIVSGWCFNDKKHTGFLKFLAVRARMLLVPYIFWAVLLFGIWSGFYYLTDSTKCVPLEVFLQGLLYNNAEISPFAAIQWFMTCMFFAQIISWVVIRICAGKAVTVAVCAVAAATAGYVLPYVLPFRLPLSLDVSFTASAFYLLGWLIAHKVIPGMSESVRKALSSVWALTGCVLVGGIAACLNGSVNMRLMTYSDPLLFYVSAILLSFAVMRISAYFQSVFTNRTKCVLYRLVLYIGKNTLLILMLNQVLIRFARIALSRFDWYERLGGTSEYLLMAGVSILVILAIAVISIPVNRMMPFSVGQSRKSFSKHRMAGNKEIER